MFLSWSREWIGLLQSYDASNCCKAAGICRGNTLECGIYLHKIERGRQNCAWHSNCACVQMVEVDTRWKTSQIVMHIANTT